MTYSIRKLHLTTRRDIAAEFLSTKSERSQSLIALFEKSPGVLKVMARAGELPSDLAAVLAQHGMTFSAATSKHGYFFADPMSLQEWANSRQALSSEAAFLVEALRQFLNRQRREEFVLATKPDPLHLAGPALIMGVLNCTPTHLRRRPLFSVEAAAAHG
jgi:hypothetical protein